ncbi:MAG: PdxA family protein [Vampirovibrionales bacterium]
MMPSSSLFSFSAPTPTAPPCYALSAGDPLGIGYEITLKLLIQLASQHRHQPLPFRLSVVAHLAELERQSLLLQLPLPSLAQYGDWLQYIPVEVARPSSAPFSAHSASPSSPPTPAQAGDIAFQSVVKAVELQHQALNPHQGLVTAPISKDHWWQAGHAFQGHTELLESLANKHVLPSSPLSALPQSYQSDMIFMYKKFILLLLTRHVPLANVPTALANNNNRQSVQHLIQFLTTRLGIEQPRLGLLGLNPHAGEIGGDEEAHVLEPLRCWVNEQTPASLSVPQPADAYFRGFNPTAPPHDAVLACYHDQGLIPMKLLAGFEAINITLGLPFLRTSVSHGTAMDIAGLGRANATSLHDALWLLHQLCKQL